LESLNFLFERRKIRLTKGITHIISYSFLMGLFIFALKWLQWKYLIADHSVEIYIGAVALLFTVLGIWIAHKIIKPKTERVIIEKEVLVPSPIEPVFNKAAWEKLGLTSRENDVLQLLVKGYSNAEIAGHLFLSISTIKTHVSNLFFKLDVTNRVKAIEKAKTLRIIQNPG
jgi:DNA-binding CsgD family transcriptional regulator